MASIPARDDFNIRDHLDVLEPSPKKERDKYICPVCGGHNLWVSPDGKGFECYGSKDSPGCDGGDVKVAVKKLAGTFVERGARQLAIDTPPPPDGVQFLIHPIDPPSSYSDDKPDWLRKPKGAKLSGYTIYQYSNIQRVARFHYDDGGKDFRPYNREYDRWTFGAGKSPWPLYGRVYSGSWALAVEGEKDVDTALRLGLAATCPRGKASSKTLPELYQGLKDAGVTGIVAIADNDTPGWGSADTAAAAAAAVGLPAIALPITALWPDAPEKGDLTDWVDATGGALTGEAIVQAIQQQTRAIAAAAAASMRGEGSQSAGVIEDEADDDLGQNLIADIDRLLDRGLFGAEREAAIAALAVKHKQPARNINAIVAERIAEHDKIEDRAHTIRELEQQRMARIARLDLSAVLPPDLAKPIAAIANKLNLRPENYLMTLLPTVSSLHKNGTFLELIPDTDYAVTPGLYCGIVAPPSQRKTPIVKAIASKPLQRLHNTVRALHEMAHEEWEIQCRNARADGVVEPKEPQQRLYYFSTTTGEAILRQAARQPSNGLLYLCDELAALFGNLDAYRKGGADKEQLLSLYDGQGGKVLRSGGIQDDIDTVNFAIVGAIQPEVLLGLMGDGSDSNGQWSRFMFVNQPVAENIITEIGGRIDITSRLAALYQAIDNLPPMAYHLAPDASRRFLARRNDYERARCAETRPAMASYYGKSDGRIGKVAMNLHVLNWAAGDRRDALPPDEIPLTTVEAAIAVVDFSIAQIQSLYAENQTGGNNITPPLAKILENLDRKGILSPRDVYAGFGRRFNYGSKSKAETVKGWFKELENMGLAKTRSRGRSVELLSANDDIEECDSKKLSSLSSNSSNPYGDKVFNDDNPVINLSSLPDLSSNLTQFDDNDDNDDKVGVINETPSGQGFQAFDDNDDSFSSFDPPLETLYGSPLGVGDAVESSGETVVVIQRDREFDRVACLRDDGTITPWLERSETIRVALASPEPLCRLLPLWKQIPGLLQDMVSRIPEELLRQALALFSERDQTAAWEARQALSLVACVQEGSS